MNEKEFITYKKANIRNRQRKLNKKFADVGLTDEVLEEQIEINREVALLDLSDEEYVQ